MKYLAIIGLLLMSACGDANTQYVPVPNPPVYPQPVYCYGYYVNSCGWNLYNCTNAQVYYCLNQFQAARIYR